LDLSTGKLLFGCSTCISCKWLTAGQWDVPWIVLLCCAGKNSTSVTVYQQFCQLSLEPSGSRWRVCKIAFVIAYPRMTPVLCASCLK